MESTTYTYILGAITSFFALLTIVLLGVSVWKLNSYLDVAGVDTPLATWTGAPGVTDTPSSRRDVFKNWLLGTIVVFIIFGLLLAALLYFTIGGWMVPAIAVVGTVLIALYTACMINKVASVGPDSEVFSDPSTTTADTYILLEKPMFELIKSGLVIAMIAMVPTLVGCVVATYRGPAVRAEKTGLVQSDLANAVGKKPAAGRDSVPAARFWQNNGDSR